MAAAVRPEWRRHLVEKTSSSVVLVLSLMEGAAKGVSRSADSAALGAEPAGRSGGEREEYCPGDSRSEASAP